MTKQTAATDRKKFLIPMPAGTRPGSHYLHFTNILFNISYYTNKPKEYAAMLEKGEIKVYLSIVGPIPIVKIKTPMGPLLFAPNPMLLSDEEFEYWVNERRTATAALTFYLINMRNVIVATRDVTIVGQWHIYKIAERMREIYTTAQQVEDEADYIFRTYSPATIEKSFKLIG